MNAQKKLKHPQRVHAGAPYPLQPRQLSIWRIRIRQSVRAPSARLRVWWMSGSADEQLSVEARQKEAGHRQCPCAYVRSPFAPAFKAEAFESDTPPANYAGDFATDLAASVVSRMFAAASSLR